MSWPLGLTVENRGWQDTRLRSFLTRRKRYGRSDLPLLSVNLPVGVTKRLDQDGRPAPSLDLGGYQEVRPGDVVMNQLGKPHGAIGVSTFHGITSPAYFVAEIGPSAEPRYVHHLLRTELFIGEYQRRGKNQPPNQFDISWDQFRDIELSLPPLAEQRAIADYLDAETARIDALIAKKQQLIHLLEERRLDKTETVITGLAFGEKVSRTGYFSRVPAKWGETLLRHLLVSVQTGPFGSQLHAEEYVDGNGWPVVNPANIRDGRITPIDSMMISDIKRAELGRHILREGDIVFGRRGEMGRAGLVTPTEAGWLCGTGSLRLRLADERLQADYLERLLRTQALKQYFLLNSVGSTMDNLNSEIVLDMPCLLPPIEAQSELVRQANLIDRQTRSAVGSFAQQIALLAERRQALVTACVTGEFDVPGAA